MKLITSFILLINTGVLTACDFCGCSSVNYFLGPLPQFNKHYVGIRNSSMNYTSVSHHNSAEYSKDYFRSVDLMAGVKISTKFHIIAFLPFKFLKMQTDDGVQSNRGVGDATFVVNYLLFNKSRCTTKNVTTSKKFAIGGGIKLPTGSFAIDKSELATSANLQTGSGSLDLLANASYLYGYNDWLLGSNIAYKFNQSALGYQFGNKLSAISSLSKLVKFAKFNLIPNAGILYEWMSHDKFGVDRVDHTGGMAFALSAGTDFRIGKISVGYSFQYPLVQNFSHGQTEMNRRSLLQFNYVFN